MARAKVHSDDAEKMRAYRARRAEKAQLTDNLLHAVRNARLEDPELQVVVNAGDDAEVLQALVKHYQRRHWQR